MSLKSRVSKKGLSVSGKIRSDHTETEVLRELSNLSRNGQTKISFNTQLVVWILRNERPVLMIPLNLSEGTLLVRKPDKRDSVK